MSQTLNPHSDTRSPVMTSLPSNIRPAYESFLILYAGYTLLPIVMGADKFCNFLCDWTIYLAPVATRMTGLDGHTFMMIVGVVEILAGLIVAFRPQIGAGIVALWLCGIIVNLMLIPGFYDVAMRDFGLLVGALSLVRLSAEFGNLSFSPKNP